MTHVLISIYTVFLPNLSHQRDRTVKNPIGPYITVPHYTVCGRTHYTVCGRNLKNANIKFTDTFYPVTRTVTVNVTFLATENIPLHLPLPHAKKYSITGIVTFLVTRDKDRYFYHYFYRPI